MPFSPPQPTPQRDRVRQVQLVAAAPFRRPGLLVAEDREVVAVPGLRPHDRVVQHVALGAHLVPRHHGPVRIAQQAGVHPGEVTEVGEVLDLARGVALPGVRPGRDHGPVAVLQLGHLGQRPARLLQRGPDQAVAFLRAERGHPGLGRDPRRVLELRDRDAAAVGVVAPAVVGAHDLVAGHPAQRQRGAAVHAQVRHHPRAAVRAAPQHQRLAEQVGMPRLGAQRGGERDRMPAGPLGGQVGVHARGRHGINPRSAHIRSLCSGPGTELSIMT